MFLSPMHLRTGMVIAGALLFLGLRLSILERPLHPDEQSNLAFHVLGYEWIRLERPIPPDPRSQRAISSQVARVMMEAWRKQTNHDWHPQPWSRALFKCEDGNNAPLNSALARLSNAVWQSASGAGETRYHLIALRIPALLAAGMAYTLFVSLSVAVLGFTRGMTAAVLFAVHPLFIELSTLMRGYAFMLAAQVASWRFYRSALLHGSATAWLGGALGSFTALWCFPGYAYALFPVQAWLVWRLWRRHSRAELRCWLWAHLTAAMVWLLVALPVSLETLNFMRQAYPYPSENSAWPLRLFANAMGGLQLPTLNDLPMRSFAPFVQTIWHSVIDSPFQILVAWLAVPALATAGWRRLRRQNEPMAGLSAATFAGFVICILHQGFVEHHELMPWYGIYLTPVVCLCVAASIRTEATIRRQATWGLLFVAVFTWATFPAGGVHGRHGLYPPEANRVVGYVHRGLRVLSLPTGIIMATPAHSTSAPPARRK